MDNEIFARRLVKGKIAETIFEQMFRETKNFTILGFGYEKVLPELIQQGYKESDKTLEIIKTAPDFVVIDKIKKDVKLVEVKYLRHLKSIYVLNDVERMRDSWNPSYLFVATREGFYFGCAEEVFNNKGDMLSFPLSEDIIPKQTQERFRKILIDFEANN